MHRAGRAALLVSTLAACGRIDFDPICVGPDSPVVFQRAAQYSPGTTQGGVAGNPSTAVPGVTWSYEWTNGLDGTSWWGQPGTLLVWDDDWFAAGGAWASADDQTPIVQSNQMTQSFDQQRVGLIRLRAETALHMTVEGMLRIQWRGFVGQTPTSVASDTDVAIVFLDARRELIDGGIIPVQKSMQDTSVEERAIVIPPRSVDVERGGSLVISVRPRVESPANAWLNFVDELTISAACN